MCLVHVDDFKQEVVPLYVFALNGYFACVFKDKSAYRRIIGRLVEVASVKIVEEVINRAACVDKIALAVVHRQYIGPRCGCHSIPPVRRGCRSMSPHLALCQTRRTQSGSGHARFKSLKSVIYIHAFGNERAGDNTLLSSKSWLSRVSMRSFSDTVPFISS